MKQVLIAGAGISGLALAWSLRRRGIEARVLEAGGAAGGKLHSQHIDGFLCERGPQSFSFREPAAQALVRALGLEGRLVVASGDSLRRCALVGGRLEDVPAAPLAFARSALLPWRAKLRALLDLGLPRGPAARGGEESVASFARRRLGAAAAERVFLPLASGGIYAEDPELVSLPSAFPAFARLERERRSLLRGLFAAAEGPRIATFQSGMGELPGALARALGGDLHLRSELLAVRERRGRLLAAGSEGGRAFELEADALALAVPAHTAGPALAGLDSCLAQTLTAIPYAPIAVCYLGYRREALPPLRRYGFLVPPGERSPLLGGVFTSSVFPGHARPGCALVALRLGGARGAHLLEREDDELSSLAHAELQTAVGAAAPPVFSRVFRHRHGLPVYALGHRQRLLSAEAAERRHPGLFLAGNAYRGLGVADCIRDGESLADRISAFLRSTSR